MLLNAVSALVLVVVSVTIWWIPWQRWLKLSNLSSFSAASVMLTLGLYSIVVQQGGVLESGFRCDGNFATGTSFATILRLIEAVAGTAVAVTGQRSLLAVAFAYLSIRVIGTVAYGLLLHRFSPWLTLGYRHARLATIRELWTPALGFMAMPLGNALSFQGLTIVVGSVLGPSMVVAFSTMRTLTRVSCQLLTVIARVLWPELSSAFGAGDIPLAIPLCMPTAWWPLAPAVSR
jgi:O-antigen/teichoic acid export membrane protein